MEAKTANAVDAQSARFTWTVEKFSSLNDEFLFSEFFYVGGHKWVVVIFREKENYDRLAIYLAVADSETLPNGWSRNIEFGLSVINYIENKSTVKKAAKAQFNAEDNNWGYTDFMPLSELCDPGRGYLVNDTCVVEVDFPHFRSVELTVEVEVAKTAASGKGETPKSSSSQGDIDRETASGTDAILPQTQTSGPRPASKSSTEVIKTSVPPITPIVEKETSGP